MRKQKLEELKYYLESLKTIEQTRKNKEPSFIKSEVYDCRLQNGEIITREKLLKGENGVRKGDDYMKNYFVSQYGAIKSIDFSPIFEDEVSKEGNNG